MIEHAGWPLQPDLCRADLDFIDYIKEQEPTRGSIFHMGPGLHHEVGLQLSGGHAIWSITNSPEEMQAYIGFVAQRPTMQWAYRCMYGDIHSLNAKEHLPNRLGGHGFRWITLFHLGETPDPARAEYAPLHVEGVIGALADSLDWNGEMLFYSRSSAWDRTAEAVNAVLDMGRLIVRKPFFRSLCILERP